MELWRLRLWLMSPPAGMAKRFVQPIEGMILPFEEQPPVNLNTLDKIIPQG